MLTLNSLYQKTGYAQRVSLSSCSAHLARTRVPCWKDWFPAAGLSDALRRLKKRIRKGAQSTDGRFLCGIMCPAGVLCATRRSWLVPRGVPGKVDADPEQVGPREARGGCPVMLPLFVSRRRPLG